MNRACAAFRLQISEHLLFDVSKTLTAVDSIAMSTLWQQGYVLEVMDILWLFHFFVFLISSVTAGRLEVGNTTSTDIWATGVACACGAPKALDTA